jgi:NAD(P)H-nitrite reductase large subunit
MSGGGMRHVILGNGPAGVIAAETIRKNAPLDDILLIGDEAEHPYSRMAIPNLLAGQVHEAATHLRRDHDYFSRMRIEQMTGRAVHVSTRTRTVKTEDGSAIEFDRLLIATGATPRVPVIPGIDFPCVHACWTLEDARRIMRLAQPRARVVLIGAGFIGCVVMEALAARGVDLTVVEKRDRMLPNMMGKPAGEMIRRWCERKGIRVHTSTRVTAIGCISMESGSPNIVRLSNGEQLKADLVIYSTGTTPNIAFLKGSGIRYLQGVVVDASMQTNVPGVYAAGDCAESYDNVTGRTVISGVQPNAGDQAYCAALNMTGKYAFQRNVRQIDVLDTMGLISSSLGHWQGVRGGQWVEVADEHNFKYLRLEFSKDVLIGCNTVGLIEHATILRSLIQHHVHLGEWKDRLLQDPTLLKEAYSACVEQQYINHASVFHPPNGRRAAPARHAV